jgi:hypothetical protein
VFAWQQKIPSIQSLLFIKHTGNFYLSATTEHYTKVEIETDYPDGPKAWKGYLF